MATVQENRIIDFDFGKFEYLENGILRFVAKNQTFSIEEFKLSGRVIHKLTGGKNVPYLVDQRSGFEPLSSEAKVWLKHNLHKYFTVIAVIEDSAVLRFFVNNFIMMYRPKVKVRLFKNRQEAEQWLLTFL